MNQKRYYKSLFYTLLNSDGLKKLSPEEVVKVLENAKKLDLFIFTLIKRFKLPIII